MTGGVIVSIAVCKMKGGIVTRKPRIFTDSTEGIPKTKPIASEFIRRSNNRLDCRLQNERGNSYTETTDFHRFHGRRGRRYTQIMRAEGPEGMPLVHPFGRYSRCKKTFTMGQLQPAWAGDMFVENLCILQPQIIPKGD